MISSVQAIVAKHHDCYVDLSMRMDHEENDLGNKSNGMKNHKQ